jgi:hypothetical protein
MTPACVHHLETERAERPKHVAAAQPAKPWRHGRAQFDGDVKRDGRSEASASRSSPSRWSSTARAQVGDGFVERASLRDDRQLDALREVPSAAPGDDAVEGGAPFDQRHGSIGRLPLAHDRDRARPPAAVPRRELIPPAADPREVVPLVRMVLRRVDAASARHVSANRAWIHVRQGADDVVGRERGVAALGADAPRRGENLLVVRHRPDLTTCNIGVSSRRPAGSLGPGGHQMRVRLSGFR